MSKQCRRQSSHLGLRIHATPYIKGKIEYGTNKKRKTIVRSYREPFYIKPFAHLKAMIHYNN